MGHILFVAEGLCKYIHVINFLYLVELLTTFSIPLKQMISAWCIAFYLPLLSFFLFFLSNEQDVIQVHFWSRVSQVWIPSSFTGLFARLTVNEPSVPYNLPVAGDKIVGCISFPRVFALWERQTALLRFWTLFVRSISYDD